MTDVKRAGSSRTTIIVALIGLAGTVGSAAVSKTIFPSSAAPCANIQGDYLSEEGRTGSVVQMGCLISGKAHQRLANGAPADIDYQFNGEMKVDYGRYTVIREDHTANCIAALQGYITDIDRSQYVAHIYSTNGKCGLDVNYHHDLTWLRNL
jgi:hypothetical protein